MRHGGLPLWPSRFRWLASSTSEGAQRANFEALLRRVDGELAASGGPYFLGADLSLVDCMFAPFLERMAASLPYYKALTLRRNDGWPRIEQWFLAMESCASSSGRRLKAVSGVSSYLQL